MSWSNAWDADGRSIRPRAAAFPALLARYAGRPEWLNRVLLEQAFPRAVESGYAPYRDRLLQLIQVLRRGASTRRGIVDVVAEEEVEHVGPRRRIHDPRHEPLRRQQAREARLRPAPVAVGIEVRADRDPPAAHELRRERLDGASPGGRDGEQVFGHEVAMRK